MQYCSTSLPASNTATQLGASQAIRPRTQRVLSFLARFVSLLSHTAILHPPTAETRTCGPTLVKAVTRDTPVGWHEKRNGSREQQPTSTTSPALPWLLSAISFDYLQELSFLSDPLDSGIRTLSPISEAQHPHPATHMVAGGLARQREEERKREGRGEGSGG